MYNTNVAFAYQEESWTLPEWNYLVSEISKVFRFTKEEEIQFLNSRTAKIIATIPFEAKCLNPERTAIAHLCLYVAEIQGFQKYCSHLASDDKDVFDRLAFISTFEGGNKDVINHCMNVLALIMIEGYQRTKLIDKKNGIYNPFVSGKWDYQTLKNKLLWEIQKIEVPNVDCLLTTKIEMIW